MGKTTSAGKATSWKNSQCKGKGGQLDKVIVASYGKTTSEKESEIKREVVADSGIQWGVYSPEASKRATGTASCYRRKKKSKRSALVGEAARGGFGPD